jgi:hypothetical protein
MAKVKDKPAYTFRAIGEKRPRGRPVTNPRSAVTAGLKGYELIKAVSLERARIASTAGRDIAPLPKCKNPKRRKKALASLRNFCEIYFPETFPLEWSLDHLKVLTKLETAIREGGQYAIAMSRGFGKSSICEIAAIWALFTGLHQFVCLIGAESGHAIAMLDSIKVELESNPLLLADFPEIVYPIHRMENIAQRTKGQTHKGKPTHMEWSSDVLVLPSIEKSLASGGIIRTAGLGARVRGMKFKRSDGKPVRPTLVILDDPQTDDSARSPSQVQKRVELVNGAVLNLAGPGKKIAAVMPCTVIQQNDLADQVLNVKLFPTWQGERMKLVYKWPDRMDMWETYIQMRRDSLEQGGRGEAANEYYKQNQAVMDEGSVCGWKWFFKPPEEISAIQCAINLRFRDAASERAFMAEQQNEPLPPIEEMRGGRIWAFTTLEHLNGLPKGQVPLNATTLTSFIDVQGEALFWLVAAWENNFTGHIVDYDAFPDQSQDYFTLDSIKRKLSDLYPNAGLEGAIYAALGSLTSKLLTKEYVREDGAGMRIKRCLIDANWGDSTEVVKKFCRQSAYSGLITPSHGRAVGASGVPFSEYKRKSNDKIGLNWRIPGRVGKEMVQHVLWDGNFWKTFIMHRVNVSMGDPGALTVFGRDERVHVMLRDHILAEYPIETTGRGRTVHEWQPRVVARDNHWFDCLVGSYVAASMEGIVLSEHAAVIRLRKKITPPVKAHSVGVQLH